MQPKGLHDHHDEKNGRIEQNRGYGLARFYALVAELEDAPDLGSGFLWVRLPPRVPNWRLARWARSGLENRADT